jgi:hypothetical protein
VCVFFYFLSLCNLKTSRRGREVGLRDYGEGNN